SYTEREYDLAVDSRVPILPFLHNNPQAIPAGNTELDPKARKRLEKFREKVQSAHHCKYWETAEQLKSQAILAINSAIRIFPRIGWIRGDTEDSAETLRKLTTALEESAHLRNQVSNLTEALNTSELKDLLAF